MILFGTAHNNRLTAASIVFQGIVVVVVDREVVVGEEGEMAEEVMVAKVVVGKLVNCNSISYQQCSKAWRAPCPLLIKATSAPGEVTGEAARI